MSDQETATAEEATSQGTRARGGEVTRAIDFTDVGAIEGLARRGGESTNTASALAICALVRELRTFRAQVTLDISIGLGNVETAVGEVAQAIEDEVRALRDDVRQAGRDAGGHA